MPVILLVEDEPFIRMAAADVLTQGGFAVLEAQDAEEALEIVAANASIDLLFTDVNLSDGIDGLELSRIVEARRPEVKLVVTSGRERIPTSELPDDGVFLPKPYRAEEVCRVLRCQLAR